MDLFQTQSSNRNYHTHNKSKYFASTSLAKALVPLAITLSFAGTAHAQSSLDSFKCTDTAYLVLGNPSFLSSRDSSTGIETPIGNLGTKYNGIGYNIVDNYIYGFDQSNNQFGRLGFTAGTSTPAIELLGLPSGSGSFPSSFAAGTLDGSGNWYGVKSGILYVVDIGNAPSSGSLTYTATPQTGVTDSAADISFSSFDGNLYGVRSNQIMKINPANGAASYVTGVSGVTPPSVAGGSWSSSNGNVYFYDNKNGTGTYEFNPDTKVITRVGPSNTNGSFDATACTPLTLTKSVVGGTKTAGGTIIYEFEAANPFATSVPVTSFTDTLTSPDVTFDTSSLTPAAPGGGTVSNFTTTNLTIDNILIPGGSTAKWQTTVDLASSLANGASVSNAASMTVGSDTIDSKPPGGGTGPTTVTLSNQADLVTEKSRTSSSATPSEGDTVTFEIKVTNNGPADETGISLTDSLPAGLTATANNGNVTAGTYDAGTGIWTIASLANGASAVLTIEGTVDAGQASNTITNTLANPASGNSVDPSTTGDDLTESVTVDDEADLSITKTNTPGVNGEVDQAADEVVSGISTTYTLVVTNNGPSQTTGAVVTDVVGSGLTCTATDAVTITGDGVPATSFTIADLTGGGIILGTLKDGESTTLSYSCEVN